MPEAALFDFAQIVIFYFDLKPAEAVFDFDLKLAEVVFDFVQLWVAVFSA
jgi:hypothetical protein